MLDALSVKQNPFAGRLGRLAGGLVLAASLAFIGQRLLRLDWSTLQLYASWNVAGAVAVAIVLFALADHALARAWSVMADPGGTLPPRALSRIYGHGVLMKYLPGAVFQYVSRQLGGTRAGLAQMQVARSAMVEVGLHLVSSTSVAAGCLLFARHPLGVTAVAAVLICGCLLSRRSLLRSLALQILAFGAFAAAAAMVASAILPSGTGLAHFAAIFLLSWLAGFVVPVAPGGLGVREAALLTLAGGGAPAAAILAATLALRIASIAGDLAYGLTALARGRSA